MIKENNQLEIDRIIARKFEKSVNDLTMKVTLIYEKQVNSIKNLESKF